MNKKHYQQLNETLVYQRLNNGLDVYIIPKKEYFKTYTTFVTRFGAHHTAVVLDDTKEKFTIPLGTAHFLEHKLFETATGEDITHIFNEVGADVNAFTTYEQTAYMTISTQNTEYVIEQLLDFVQNTHFSEASIKKEQNIIEQERKLYLDNPRSRSRYGLLRNLYHHHPLRENILGTKQSIFSITKDILFKAHRLFYHPSNMLLVIVGDVDPSHIIEVVTKNQSEKHFEPQLSYTIPPIIEPRKVKLSSKVNFMDVAVPRASVGCKIDLKKIQLPQFKLDTMLTMMLEDTFGFASNAYQTLLDQKLINTQFSYYATVGEDYCYVMIGANTNQPEAFIAFIKKQIIALSQYKFDETSFGVIKNALIGSKIKMLDDLESIAHEFIDQLLSDDDYFLQLDTIQNIQIQDFKKLQYVFTEDVIADFIVLPKK